MSDIRRLRPAQRRRVVHALESEQVPIKLIGKTLSPFRPLICDELIKYLLKFETVSKFLVARRFIDKRNNSDVRETAQDNLRHLGNHNLART